MAGEKGAMAALASRAVADEVVPLLLAPGTGLGPRLNAAEAALRGVRVQLDLAAAAQDKQSSRSSALEEQVTAGHLLRAVQGWLLVACDSVVDWQRMPLQIFVTVKQMLWLSQIGLHGAGVLMF